MQYFNLDQGKPQTSHNSGPYQKGEISLIIFDVEIIIL